MRRWKLTLQAIVIVLAGGISGSWLHAQPPPEIVTVTGTVTEARTGRPAAGATVTLTPETEGEEVVVPWRGQTTTDEEGQFTLKDVPEGRYTLSLSAPGCQSFSQELKVVFRMKPLTLTIQRPPQIRGQLRRVDGTLLANTPIQFSLVRLDRVSREGGTPGSTDGEGRYGILALPPGKYRLTIVVPGVGYARSGELILAGEDVQGVDLRLAPVASVAGQVRVRSTDQPAQRVWVSCATRDGPRTVEYGSTQVDDQGRFAFQNLPAGTYQVGADGGEYLPLRPQTLTLADGQAVTDFVLEIALLPVVSIRLLAPDGTLLAGREVVFQGYTHREGGYSSTGIWTRLKLDANSGFAVRVPDLGPAQARLWLAGVGYMWQDLEIREGEGLKSLEWRLKPFATVGGWVWEKRTGKPLAGVQVALWRQESGPGFPVPRPQATSDADGRFELKDVVPGKYRVRVNAEGYRPAVGQRIRVPEDAAPEELLIELESGTPVKGRVLGPDGTTLTVEE
jgi:5-hydroxyisourate hydrolase-like protein (transthyretin family)